MAQAATPLGQMALRGRARPIDAKRVVLAGCTAKKVTTGMGLRPARQCPSHPHRSAKWACEAFFGDFFVPAKKLPACRAGPARPHAVKQQKRQNKNKDPT